MSRQIDELLLRRGRLLERIAGQRETLRRDFVPVASSLGRADAAVAVLRVGAEYLRRHALASTVLAGTFLVFKGRAALRWGGRAFWLWKSWRSLRGALAEFENRVREGGPGRF